MKILAIDGGTYHTGWAVFDGKHLRKASTIDPNPNDWSFQRIANIFNTISELIDRHQVDVLAWESWRGPRNPELQTMLRCFTQLAKDKGCEAIEFHASTVVKQMALNGKGRKRREARKAAIREGVIHHYPKYRDVPQDAMDAIAIGRCVLLERGIVH